MIYLLLRPGTENQFANTQKVVVRLLILTVNSGAWTAVLAVLDLICIVAFPTDFTFLIFELPLCSLYLSTLLANLNARKFINNYEPTSIDLSDRNSRGGRTNATGTVLEPIHFVPQSTRRTAFSSQDDSTEEALKKMRSQGGSDAEMDRTYHV
ncbi:hypothetical protein B0H10DRAFT_2145082 [Mycena sp. CBHHK59/15]|nr:hypothetical protein B0H10DRAFT_2145082 [Mycena sp. CBHHK59/15]